MNECVLGDRTQVKDNQIINVLPVIKLQWYDKSTLHKSRAITKGSDAHRAMTISN